MFSIKLTIKNKPLHVREFETYINVHVANDELAQILDDSEWEEMMSLSSEDVTNAESPSNEENENIINAASSINDRGEYALDDGYDNGYEADEEDNAE